MRRTKDVITLNAWFYLKEKGFEPVRFVDEGKDCGLGCELKLEGLKGLKTTTARQEIVIQPYAGNRSEPGGWVIFHPNGIKYCNSWNLQKTVEGIFRTTEFLKSYYTPNNSNKP
nr:hypothetical protein [uncultured Arsenicibacter sp.]